MSKVIQVCHFLLPSPNWMFCILWSMLGDICDCGCYIEMFELASLPLLIPLVLPPWFFLTGVWCPGFLKALSFVEDFIWDFLFDCSSFFTSSSRMRSPIIFRTHFIRSSIWPAIPFFWMRRPFLRERREDYGRYWKKLAGILIVFNSDNFVSLTGGK